MDKRKDRNIKFHTGYLICILLLNFSCFAQVNLVPNPSFEQESPTRASRTFTHGGRPFQKLIEPWYMPTSGTSDYYNSDRSNIYLSVPVKTARSGEGRVATVIGSLSIPANYSEYVQVKLIKPLVKDSLYCVGMHFAIDKRSKCYSSALGLALTNSALTDTSSRMLLYEPELECTDSLKLMADKGWQFYKAIYKAKGGEQYLTLGSFNKAALRPRKVTTFIESPMERFSQYAYYYFDDISVVPVTREEDCSEALEEKIKPAENHFVFLVDVSQSMIRAGHLAGVKKALLRFADTLGRNDLVTILCFDARTKVLLRAIPAWQKQELARAIDQIEAGNVTNIDKAISRTYEVLDSTFKTGAAHRLVLLSDAQFDLSSASKKIIKSHFGQKNINFNMVQFGTAENKGLQKIIDDTKGVYVSSSGNDLHKIFGSMMRKPKRRYDYTLPRGGLTWEDN